MGPHRVVVPPPTLDEHLGLQQRVELLSGQELVLVVSGFLLIGPSSKESTAFCYLSSRNRR